MLAALVIFACIVSRVVPHPWNFTLVGAAAIFAGRTLPLRSALSFTLAMMLMSDVVLVLLHGTSYVSGVTPFVYAGLAAQAALGFGWRRRRGGAIVAALLGATAFFVLSNFGVWAMGHTYARTASGLATCYAAAIPFFRASLAGDVLWTLVLSLAYRPVARWLSSRGPRWVAVPLSEIAPF